MLYGMFVENCQCSCCARHVSVYQSSGAALPDIRQQHHSIISHNFSNFLKYWPELYFFNLNLASSRQVVFNWGFISLTYGVIRTCRRYSLIESLYLIFLIHSCYVLTICLVYSWSIMSHDYYILYP